MLVMAMRTCKGTEARHLRRTEADSSWGIHLRTFGNNLERSSGDQGGKPGLSAFGIFGVVRVTGE